ncbi:MAG TPA: hypothetical protein QF753_05320 [Victivallales bacterium]|nr:hypothetical protein [Victivallales bacterium]
MRFIVPLLLCCLFSIQAYTLDLTTKNGVVYTDIEIQNFKAPNVYFKSKGKEEIIKSSNFTDGSIEDIRKALIRKDSITMTIGQLNNKINILKDELNKLEPKINKTTLEDFEELMEDSEDAKSSELKSLKSNIDKNQKIIEEYKNGEINPSLKSNYSLRNGAWFFRTGEIQQQVIEKNEKKLSDKKDLFEKLENNKGFYYKSMSPENMKNGDMGTISESVTVFQIKSIYEMLCKVTSSKSTDYRGRNKQILFWIDGVKTDKFSKGEIIHLKDDVLYVAGNTSYKTDDGYKTVPLLKKIDTDLYLKFTRFKIEIKRYNKQLETIKVLNSI